MIDAKDARELTRFFRRRKSGLRPPNRIYIEDSMAQLLWSPYSLDFHQLDAGWGTIATAAVLDAKASLGSWGLDDEKWERECNGAITRSARNGRSFLLWECGIDGSIDSRPPHLFVTVHNLQRLGYRFVEKAFYNYPCFGWFSLLFYWGVAKPEFWSLRKGIRLD